MTSIYDIKPAFHNLLRPVTRALFAAGIGRPAAAGGHQPEHDRAGDEAGPCAPSTGARPNTTGARTPSTGL